MKFDVKVTFKSGGIRKFLIEGENDGTTFSIAQEFMHDQIAIQDVNGTSCMVNINEVETVDVSNHKAD